MLWVTDCVKCFSGSMYLILIQSPQDREHVSLILARGTEVQHLAQSHQASEKQTWDSEAHLSFCRAGCLSAWHPHASLTKDHCMSPIQRREETREKWSQISRSRHASAPALKAIMNSLLLIKNRSVMWRRKWHPTPVLLPGKSHGWRRLVGCSPWGHKESDMTERLHFHFSLSCTGKGNGNPLQYSCLENPMDGGDW